MSSRRKLATIFMFSFSVPLNTSLPLLISSISSLISSSLP